MSKKKKVLMMVLAALIGLLLLACAAFYVVFDVPNWQKLDASKLSALAQTSSMYDAQGELMSELRGAENRNIVSLDEIPMHTRQAFLAAEDLRFYEHRGIDVYRILGALRSNIKNGTLAEGASTITQQLAKLTHLSAEKTIRRKLEEIHLAFQIEAAYSKDEILAMYLNTVYFGRGAYGIQAAAQAYFGVDVSALTLNQSASLAAIIKAPSVYAPHINPSSNRSRRQYILSVMEDNGFITQEEAREARGESVWVLAREAEKQSYGWYIDEAKQALEDGSIVFAGKYSAPDYELILSKNCDLALESTMIYHNPEVKEKLEEFGIPVLVEHSSYESHPLGRTEWVKLYGVLLDKEEEAEAVFEEQAEKLNSIKDSENTGKTVAFFYPSSSASLKSSAGIR